MMPLDNIRIVLVSPLYGGNIGSVCRAMANMGLSDLTIATPRKTDEEEMRMMTCSATDIMEKRKLCPTLAEAVCDCGLIVGTSARLGLYRSHAHSPRDIAPRILEAAATCRVAIMFGPEDRGLNNEELSFCGPIIQIPTTEEYRSINLAQSVMICCYELFTATGAFVPSQEPTPEAPSEVKERMFALWRETLLKIGFMNDAKADHIMLGLRRILSRGKLTINDVKIMMGIARQSAWAAGSNLSNRSDLGGAEPAGVRKRRKTHEEDPLKKIQTKQK